MLDDKLHLSVLEIWRLSMPPGTVLAGGRAGIDRAVEWVASLRGAFPLFGDLEEGYLAIANLELARRLDTRLTLDYLIEALHGAGASSLLVNEPASDQDQAKADALGLPLFVLPKQADLRAVERDILRALVDREGQLARHEMETRQRLQALFGSGGLEAVLADLAEQTRGAVTAIDGDGIEIGSAAVGTVEPALQVACFPIQVAGQILGQLELRLPASMSTPLAAVQARQTAEICGIEILQQRTRRETEERMGIELIELLLDERQREAATARLLRLGYDLGDARRHLAVLVGSAEDAEPSATIQAVASDLQWAAQRDGATVLTSAYRGQMLALCSIAPGTSDRRVRQWLSEAISSLSGSTAPASCGTTAARGCSLGVSRIASDLAGLRAAIGQAVDAWTLGQRIQGLSSPHYYDEMGLYRLLAALRNSDEIQRFYAEMLASLVAYDQENNTELIATLEAFFRQNTNISRTAQALYVHRNTLTYRLQRIVDISGFDLDDAEARLAFQVALKVHRLGI